MARKSKQNNTNKKKKKNPAKRSQPRPKSNMALMSTAMGICAVTNPFCPEAVGARWPDGIYSKTVPMTTINGTTVMTDANGRASVRFLPSASMFYHVGVVGAGGDAVFPFDDTYFPGTAAPTGVQRYRLTSWGVKVQCSQSRMTAQGKVYVRLFSPMKAATINTVNIFTPYADGYLDVPVSRHTDKDLFITPAPLGEIARLFDTPVGLTTETWTNPGWQALVISVSGGAPSTGVLDVTLYAHYEYVYDDTDTRMQLASKPPSSSVLTRAGAAGVFNQIGNFFDGVGGALDSVFQNRATKYVAAALTRNPAPALMNGGRGIMVD